MTGIRRPFSTLDAVIPSPFSIGHTFEPLLLSVRYYRHTCRGGNVLVFLVGVIVVVGRYGSKYLKSEIKTTKTEPNGRTNEAIDSKTTADRRPHTSTLFPLSFPRSKAALAATNKLLSFGRLDSTLCLMNGIYNRRGGGEMRLPIWREVS